MQQPTLQRRKYATAHMPITLNNILVPYFI